MGAISRSTNFGQKWTIFHSPNFHTKLIMLIWGPDIQDPERTLIHFLNEKWQKLAQSISNYCSQYWCNIHQFWLKMDHFSITGFSHQFNQADLVARKEGPCRKIGSKFQQLLGIVLVQYPPILDKNGRLFTHRIFTPNTIACF